MRIAVVGCAGRMGQMLVREITADGQAELAAATERAGSPAIGRDAGVLAGQEPAGVIVTADPAAAFAAAQAVIDFTVPSAVPLHAGLAALHGSALVIGTTGLGPAEDAAIDDAAKSVPVVQAPNMSLGINLLCGLVERVARTLGPAFDIEIVEMHHRHKVDAPSGTGLALGRAAAAGRGVGLDEAALRGRDGHTGVRPEGGIGFAVMRGGDVVGDHTVVFAGPGERLELGHRAGGRHIYAAGAVHAALWCAARAPGRYGMADVLGL